MYLNIISFFFRVFYYFVNAERVSKYSLSGRSFYGKICNIYDGDTYWLVFMDGLKLVKMKCRSYGYDSPEMSPLLSSPYRDKEKKYAIHARNYLRNICEKNGYVVWFRAYEFDKYGRLLVDLYSPDRGVSYNRLMLENTHSYEYYGRTKMKFGRNGYNI